MKDLLAPEWFTEAVNTPYDRHKVIVDGCEIAYQSWGDNKKPGLLLLHGNGAHAHWWDFIAPTFIDNYYVVAFDLSGMGNSGHRDFYSSDTYVREIKSVCDAANFVAMPLLIGHSLGGRLVFKAEQTYPEDFFGIIMADSPFNPVDRKFHFEERRKKGVKPHRTYDDFNTLLARFRLFPEQPCANSYIVDYIGRHSIKTVGGGFQWKFDPKTYSQLDFEPLLTIQPKATDKILAMVYGDHSKLYSQETLAYNQATLAALGKPAARPLSNAYHHLFLDQPLAFIELIKSILHRVGY